jgi:hypothetical protein
MRSPSIADNEMLILTILSFLHSRVIANLATALTPLQVFLVLFQFEKTCDISYDGLQLYSKPPITESFDVAGTPVLHVLCLSLRMFSCPC